ncbi:hypothetical protein AX17_000245 [Amanita inopinata Kibby_2008]|nr:hypothetical protein AX17_000245 [Amanita inopinata Kibby_2008]
MNTSPSINSRLSATRAPLSTPTRSATNERSSSYPAVASTNTKEVRAYEHQRQKVKKTAETANMRARKQANAIKHVFQARTSSNKSQKSLSLVDDAVDFEDHALPDSHKGDEEELELHKVPRLRHEVKLTDLIVTTRKSRKGVRDNDFEVIPHVRSVIILDDSQIQDIEIDEPWEYISGVDENQEPSNTEPISYAEAVAQVK